MRKVAIGAAALGLAAGGLARATECADDNYEALTLELVDVTVDGAPADDLTPWDLPATVQLQWDGSLVLSVDGHTTVFEAVTP